MDFGNLLYLKEETSLILVMVLLLLFDLFCTGKIRRYFQLTACVLMAVHTLIHLDPMPDGQAFGGMYINSPILSVVKTILNVGTLIIFMQARNW